MVLIASWEMCVRMPRTEVLLEFALSIGGCWGIQLPVVWLGAIVGHCVVKLLGGIVQCRAARHCRSLGGMARGHEHGYYCQAAWQSLCLHSAIKLLGGRVHIGKFTGF